MEIMSNVPINGMLGRRGPNSWNLKAWGSKVAFGKILRVTFALVEGLRSDLPVVALSFLCTAVKVAKGKSNHGKLRRSVGC